MYLRKNAESNNKLYVPYDYETADKIIMFQKLAANESKSQMVLDEVWRKFGNFSCSNQNDQIFKEIENEVRFLDGKCAENDTDCLSTVQRIMRSVYALSSLASKPPKSPGRYLGYHISSYTKCLGKV